MSRKLLSLSATAALMGGTALADVPSVAADIAPVHSLVARVMQGVGSPDLIVQPGASPHEYSLRPSEAAALQDADIVVWMGEDLAPWMEDAVETLAADAAVLTLLDAPGTTLLNFREGALFEAHDHGHGHDEHDDHDDDHDHAHDDHGHDDHDHDHDHDDHGHDDHDHDDHSHDDHDHDHSHDDHDHEHGHDDHEHGHDDHDHDGHAHGEHDPHAWLSPENATTWLNLIAAELSSADPENAGTYFANAAEAIAELDTLSAEIETILDPARGLRFIVFHDAYRYFETSFDFPASGAISISDATDPSPARIADVQTRIRDEGIDCVFAEPQFNAGLVETVLDGTEAGMGIIDPLGADLEPGPDLYPQLLRDMATTLATCS